MDDHEHEGGEADQFRGRSMDICTDLSVDCDEGLDDHGVGEGCEAHDESVAILIKLCHLFCSRLHVIFNNLPNFWMYTDKFGSKSLTKTIFCLRASWDKSRLKILLI